MQLQVWFLEVINISVFRNLLLLLFSCSVVSDSLRPHGLQHARLPCLSLFPRVCMILVHAITFINRILSSGGVLLGSPRCVVWLGVKSLWSKGLRPRSYLFSLFQHLTPKKKKLHWLLISVNLAGGCGERWVPGHSESWECSDFIVSK